MFLGDLVAGRPREEEDVIDAPGGLFRRFGFQDDSTASFLLEIARQNAWRDLTVAYFPDNDFESHSAGPTSAISTLENVDRHLGELFEVCGGIESFLRDTSILITGDHAQSDLISDEEARGIPADELLEDFSVVKAGEDWTNDDQLMVCPNMRACQIYLRRGRWAHLEEIVDSLLAEQRVDQVIWRTDSDDDLYRYHVRKRDSGELTFWESESGRGSDAFGNTWDWSGSLKGIDAKVPDSRRITYGDYPNALERIATSFAKPAGGDLWATARVGHEFKLPETALHAGGSHGSLHAWDSTSPVILAGAPGGVSLPRHLRTVDAAGLCLRILEVDQNG